MTSTTSVPNTLSGLLEPIPAERTALVQPDLNVRITYGELRRQVQDLAEALAAFGITRGDRVGMALPNGIATIVSFLAASGPACAFAARRRFTLTMIVAKIAVSSPASRSKLPVRS